MSAVEELRAVLRIRAYRSAREGAWVALLAGLMLSATGWLLYPADVAGLAWGWAIVWKTLAAICAVTAWRRKPAAEQAEAYLRVRGVL